MNGPGDRATSLVRTDRRLSACGHFSDLARCLARVRNSRQTGHRCHLPSSIPRQLPPLPSFSLPDGSNTRSTWRFSTNTKRRARRARRGARPDCGLSHTGDSVGGPERRPRQRRGFGEESPPKPLGKSPTAIRRPGRSRNADSRAPWRRAHTRSSGRPAGPRKRLAS